MRIRAAASSLAAPRTTRRTSSPISSWAGRKTSRNRVFVETEDASRTEAFAPSKMTDPSLIIYHPVRVVGGKTIVTNGDQTDTIRDYLLEGKSYIDALRTRQFEPDAPNYTSRISGVVNEDGSYSLSILKNFTSDRTANKRFFYEYDPVAGLGHFIHTYMCDGDPGPALPRRAQVHPHGISHARICRPSVGKPERTK